MDNAAQARVFLKQSDEEFANNDVLQGSEKLWGAACQAIIAVAKPRMWTCSKSNHRREVIRRLADEKSDSSLKAEYAIAEQFHANFYNNFMEDDAIETYRPMVHDLVNRLLSYNGKDTESNILDSLWYVRD